MKEKQTTFERRLEMLFLIINCRKTTTVELSKYFSVSYNTVFKDLIQLSRYAPIYTKPGMFGGVFLLDDYRKNLYLPLSSEECALLMRLANGLSELEKHRIYNIINKYSNRALGIY